MDAVQQDAARRMQAGLASLKENWGWYLALGGLLVVLGMVAIGSSMVATLVSVVFLGWLMIFGGAMEAVHAFWRKEWGGFFIELLAGILYVVVGFMLNANPAASAVTLTLVIAIFLIVTGVFRIAAALAVHPPHRGWVILSGLMSLLLGILIWYEWPISGLWVIGLFVGIEMLFNGWSLVMLALAARNLPEAPEASEAAPQSA